MNNTPLALQLEERYGDKSRGGCGLASLVDIAQERQAAILQPDDLLPKDFFQHQLSQEFTYKGVVSDFCFFSEILRKICGNLQK